MRLVLPVLAVIPLLCFVAPVVAAPPVRTLLTRPISAAPAGADALRISIYGDKSGSQVQVRLLSSAQDGVLSGYFAAAPIIVDFEGWKTFTLPLSDFSFGSDVNPDATKDGLSSKDTLTGSAQLQLAITSAASKLFFDDLGWTTASAAPTDALLASIETFEAGSVSDWKPAGDYDQIHSIRFGLTKVAPYVKNGIASLQVVVRPELLDQRQMEKPVLDKRLKAQATQPYAIYIRPPFEPVYPESVPKAAEAKTIPTLGITACPGEMEPASFAVYSVKDIKGATIRLAVPPTGPGKKTIPASAIDLRVVRVGKGLNPPELLVKDDREPLTGPLPVVRLTGEPVTDIDAETSKRFWVTVRIPANQAPGLYKGKLTFTANGIKPAGIPFTVEVSDLTLRTAFLQYGIELKTRLASEGETPGGSAVTPEILAAQLNDIRDHGVKLIMVSDTPANLQQELKAYKDANLSLSGPVVVASLHEGGEVAGVEGIKGQAGLPPSFDIYYHLPDGVTQAGDILSFGQAVSAANRNGLVVAEVQSTEDYRALTSALNDASGERLAPIYTVSSDYAQKILAAGKRSTPNRDYWTWNIPSQSALRNRLFAGFLLYKTGPGLYGAFPGPYGYVPQGTANPFAAFDPSADLSAPRPQMAAFPVQGGVLDTVQWEAVSAGVDDIRYIGALKGYIRELKDAKKRKDATDAAESYLAAVASKPLLQLSPAQHQANRNGIRTQALKLKAILYPGTQVIPAAAAPPAKKPAVPVKAKKKP
jgi:hypothetical protein